MKIIFKYTLNIGRTQQAMPRGAQPLCVQIQDKEPQLWMMCTRDAPLEWRTFDVRVTGQSLPDNFGTYIGTFQMEGGTFVGHVFEVALAAAGEH